MQLAISKTNKKKNAFLFIIYFWGLNLLSIYKIINIYLC